MLRHLLVIRMTKIRTILGFVLLGSTLASAGATPDASVAAPPAYISPEAARAALPAAEQARLDALTRQIVESAQAAATGPEAARLEATGIRLKKYADDIANQAMDSQRNKVLNFLGIDPKKDTALYIFVSWSMPLDVLRSYAIEAMWSGSTLVFRGIPPGKTIRQFIMGDLKELAYGKGASVAVSLDPRLFDTYGISSVPTFVLAEDRHNIECVALNKRNFKYQGQGLSYNQCAEADPSKYWKITGAVTTDFALEQFEKSGSAHAARYKAALAKGFATGTKPPKDQQGFSGEWKSILTPEEIMSVQSAIEAARAKQQNPQPVKP